MQIVNLLVLITVVFDGIVEGINKNSVRKLSPRFHASLWLSFYFIYLF